MLRMHEAMRAKGIVGLNSLQLPLRYSPRPRNRPNMLQKEKRMRGIVQSRISFRSLAALAISVLFLVSIARPGAAVIIDSGDGTGNTTAPVDDPGWDNVGTKSGLTVVYLRNGWVLTANHVGIGDILLDGGVFTHVPGSGVQLQNPDLTFADLLVFSLTTLPTLPDLDIRTNTSLPTDEVIMVGKGKDRGAASDSDDPGIWTAPPANPTPAIPGWYWAVPSTLRWGTNEVTGEWLPRPANTESFYTTFDGNGPDHTSHECQAATGDSGGALFAKDGTNWELAGIIWAIAGFNGQISGNSALEGNATLVADLSFYATDINAITATPLPEPGTMLQLAAGALFVGLMQRRR